MNSLSHFENVTNEMIIEKVVAMDVGKIKRGPIAPTHYGTDLLNGNKYIILENITPDKYSLIPNSFDFHDKKNGPLRMFMNYQGKKRNCRICGKHHESPDCDL